jgi:hypothetical protein
MLSISLSKVKVHEPLSKAEFVQLLCHLSNKSRGVRLAVKRLNEYMWHEDIFKQLQILAMVIKSCLHNVSIRIDTHTEWDQGAVEHFIKNKIVYFI